jgi:uncharacterized membrane protein
MSLSLTGALPVLITTFLASVVEAIEMVTIVVGVGVARGWRSTLIGAGAGAGVLVVVVALLGLALRNIPIGPLRLVIGSLLLVFGLQWLRKGVMRVAAHGLAGFRMRQPEPQEWTGEGLDWTAFVVAFKGVVLEGLEIAIIVVSFGATTSRLDAATIGAVAAVLVIGIAGVLVYSWVAQIPRSLLQLAVGILLTSFGTFWAVEGIGVDWPAGDASILVLVAVYLLTAITFIVFERRRFLGYATAA